MQRIHSVSPQSAHGRTRELFDSVRQAFGVIPNTARVMANSPAVLNSFLAFTTAMGDAKIGSRLHTLMKLNTSEANNCAYCTSILTAVAPSAGLSATDVLAGRTGNAQEQRDKAALAFAHNVLESRGKVSNSQLTAVRNAGFDDADIVEIVASVVLGCFTNFLNNVAGTELDFPQAEPIETCAAETCSGTACSVP